MNILITNDDGIYADGIIELAKSISKIANVYVVAPESQRSATGHAITIHSPIMVHKIDMGENIKSYAISGTPADCVKVGIEGLFKDINIDLVLSGINNGSNLGTDVIYSGTVSAALEGFILNKPSIAISYDEVNVKREIYKDASKYVVNLIENIKDKLDLLNDCILNVNIPNTKIKGSKITKLGQRNYDNAMVEKINPFGQKYYWIGGKLMELDQDEDSDIACVKDGYISITPINIEMTNLRKFELLKDIKMI
ncbi:MAG: 5'/3'-nucleotidase SurE [Terrisporobacter sp.]|uniref:5'/3'-nucleotidase SurE n=1 Tax=Terrisporobacter TaxID=1505652 RepID=UPI0025DE0437|nr:5'/3'-nucleotidase SurE [Terrisporobacter othiniensis]MDU2201245.1 5'/3'-nucleotidase SurE [Terrisporobacter othiniensis]